MLVAGMEHFNAARESVNVIGERIYDISQYKILEANPTIDNIKIYQLLSVLAILLVLSAIAYKMSYSFTKPIKQMADVLTEVAKGNFDSDVSSIHATGESGELREAYNKITGTVKSVMAEATALENVIERGDISQLADTTGFEGGWKDLIGGVNNVVSCLCGYMDLVPLPAMTIDCDYDVLYMNKNALEVVGKPREEAIGKNAMT